MESTTLPRRFYPSTETVSLALYWNLYIIMFGRVQVQELMQIFQIYRASAEPRYTLTRICCKAVVLLGVLIQFASMAESYTNPNTNPNGRLGRLLGSNTQCSGISLGGDCGNWLWKLNCELLAACYNSENSIMICPKHTKF
jgi:hypothetical protein